LWVSVGGNRADAVVDSHSNRKYIRTERDDSRQNNLLALAECS